MSEKTKKTILRWVISSLISFVAGFAFVMYGEMDNITIDSFQNGTFVGTLFLAVRAGIKGILELIVIASKK